VKGRRRHPHGGERRDPEWWTFGISILILAGVVVGLLAQIASGDDPPQPAAVVGEVSRQPDGTFHVPVAVRNPGDRAAAEVQVAAELQLGGTTTTGDQTIDFLGAGETERLVFVFADDPASGALRVTVTGFAVP
jgi:uncharacterized protein (TIGR02588 family)